MHWQSAHLRYKLRSPPSRDGAPLKPWTKTRRRCRAGPFPPVERRGPIEAVGSVAEAHRRTACSPPSRDGAPLKLVWLERVRGDLQEFPPVERRGPIEAPMQRRTSRVPRGCSPPSRDGAPL